VGSGVQFREGEEDLRPLRLREVFAGKLKLEYFKPNLLANTPGWDLAFAAAIDDLESAGLVLADLANAADAQTRDVGHIWAALDKLPNLAWTQARVFMRATIELANGRAGPCQARCWLLSRGTSRRSRLPFCARFQT